MATRACRGAGHQADPLSTGRPQDLADVRSRIRQATRGRSAVRSSFRYRTAVSIRATHQSPLPKPDRGGRELFRVARHQVV